MRAPDPLELEVKLGIAAWRGCQEPNSDPLEEQHTLLAAKPPL